MKLRPYQKNDFKACNKLFKIHNHILFGAATGYGKSAIIHKFAKKYKRVLIIAPRRKLVNQLYTTLELLEPSVVMGNDYRNNDTSTIHIASMATLQRRLATHGKDYIGNLDLIIIDEVHVGFNSKGMNILKELYWNDKTKWVGLSATPIDSSGYRLEGWDYTLYNNQTKDLIKIGMLKDVDVLVTDKPKDLDTLRIVAGDYNEGELDALMSEDGRVSNIFHIWKRYAQGCKTMIFAVSINHAELIYKDFVNNGVVGVGVVHSERDENEEEILLEQFETDEIHTIINVGKLTTGFDNTSVDCLLIARPTKSVALFMQICGRGLRKHENKPICKILDVAGVIEQHGFPTMKRDFNIKKPKPSEKKDTELKEITCPECEYVTQIKNCKRVRTELENITQTVWYCPNCDAIIRETIIDNNEVKRLKRIADYTNVDDIKAKDVQNIMVQIQVYKDYKYGWVQHVGNDYKKNPQLAYEIKIITNKVLLEMVNLDTALTQINNVRKKYA